MTRRAYARWLLTISLGALPVSTPAAALIGVAGLDASDAIPETAEDRIQRDFIDGMSSYSARDYRRAEAIFHQILDRDPALLRVRLELARTLYMQNKDEQADYHFRLAAGEHPPAQVMRNIARFREAIRARRSWRFSIDFGFAPDSNINSATDKESVDIYGLPFQLDPSDRVRSGTGKFAGADASLRLNRLGQVPIYLGAYGRWLSYEDHHFDDAYVGGEVGPELGLGSGRLRTTATALKRWYGRGSLVTSFGSHLEYEKLFGGKWTVGGTLLVRHNDYARRHDVDAWDAEARVSVNRVIDATTLGFLYAGVERSWATDPGQAYWQERIRLGVLKEIGWGLRPQLGIEVARQVHDSALAPFGHVRRDLLLQGSFSVYKRNWNVRGFGPSLSLTITRNRSTISLYRQNRLRGEIRATKVF